jgi:hypothetical protein
MRRNEPKTGTNEPRRSEKLGGSKEHPKRNSLSLKDSSREGEQFRWRGHANNNQSRPMDESRNNRSRQ